MCRSYYYPFQKLPRRNFIEENKVSIFTFFEAFLVDNIFLLKNRFEDLEFLEQIAFEEKGVFSRF